MKEGFWLNYETGQRFEVHDHETWLRRNGNAEKLGIAPEIVARFGEFVRGADRIGFLMFVLTHAPVIRVRGHGVDITFEFAAVDAPIESAAMEAIRRFCNDIAGPRSWVRITNLVGGKTVQFSYFGPAGKLLPDSAGAL